LSHAAAFSAFLQKRSFLKTFVCVLVCDSIFMTTLTLQRFLKLMVLLLAVTALLVWTRAERAQPKPVAQPPCTTSFPLPNPSDVGARKFEKTLYDFLDQRCYDKWVADSRIRDSGPFIGG